MKFIYQNWKFDSELPLKIFSHNNIQFYAHCHPEVEIIYVESGSLLLGVNEEKREVHAGDFIVCGSNDIHDFEYGGKESRATVLVFKPELLGSSRTWPGDFQFTSPYFTPAEKDRNRLYGLLQAIYQECEGGGAAAPASALMVRGLTMQLCADLQRCMPVAPKAKEPYEQRARLQKMLSYIEENCRTEMTLESIAGHFNMDPFHFSRTFKSTLGLSFKTYLNMVRVSLAEIKLENTDDSIMEIALECGFSSIRTFNRVYKSIKGRTPSHYRKQGAAPQDFKS
ncbi:helix-turn-helix transcriptional regulator [Paenibacillus sp. F411]|uniref:helix-turn-helix domain-containing protein n=1 Tax=Paenibacillus sp. F411 TaxID=2820239 RepID=UPI001AB003C5|nr:helix-turn-helix domain-containing protein [Paenibacillus sp. F411]MBO2945330.1 helix-turn-helix transcriptional regulator [Paenibacillus sp. F411]